MDIYNGRIGRRWNNLLRKLVVLPRMKKTLMVESATVLCNNCNAGVVLHDLGLRFDSPTVNMFFYHLDFFDFVEHLEDYLSVDPVHCENPKYMPEIPYPVMTLPGVNGNPDLELHFMHYASEEEALDSWKRRRERMDFDQLHVMWTFFGRVSPELENSSLYDRFEKLPVKKKVAFVNHPVDQKKYPSLFYIKGFEQEEGLGVLTLYSGLTGKRYIDQFSSVQWLNQLTESARG